MKSLRLEPSPSHRGESRLARTVRRSLYGVMFALVALIVLAAILPDTYPSESWVREVNAPVSLRDVAVSILSEMEDASVREKDASPRPSVDDAVRAVVAQYGIEHFRIPWFDNWAVLNPSFEAWTTLPAGTILAVAGEPGDWYFVNNELWAAPGSDEQLPDWFADGVTVETLGMVPAQEGSDR